MTSPISSIENFMLLLASRLASPFICLHSRSIRILLPISPHNTIALL